MLKFFVFTNFIITFHMVYHVNSIDHLKGTSVPGTSEPDRLLKSPKLLNSFIPASMQILQHSIESIQYDPVMITMTTSTSKPMMTTTLAPTVKPTSLHKPGYFGPEKPPSTPVPASFSTNTVQPQSETTTEFEETLLWNDKQFFEWFLQSKYKQIKLDNDYSLQLVDPLPLRLLQDIKNERYELSAFLDKDNVNEFRKVYDDQHRENELSFLASTSTVANKPNYQTSGMNGSKKRVPPTKPYIHMLMLYDLLKREAKKNMLNLYEGYSSEILAELAEANPDNGQQQLLFVLSRMLQEKNIEKSDIVARTKAMITELENEHSAIRKALVEIAPLKFAQ